MQEHAFIAHLSFFHVCLLPLYYGDSWIWHFTHSFKAKPWTNPRIFFFYFSLIWFESWGECGLTFETRKVCCTQSLNSSSLWDWPFWTCYWISELSVSAIASNFAWLNETWIIFFSETQIVLGLEYIRISPLKVLFFYIFVHVLLQVSVKM